MGKRWTTRASLDGTGSNRRPCPISADPSHASATAWRRTTWHSCAVAFSASELQRGVPIQLAYRYRIGLRLASKNGKCYKITQHVYVCVCAWPFKRLADLYSLQTSPVFCTVQQVRDITKWYTVYHIGFSGILFVVVDNNNSHTQSRGHTSDFLMHLLRFLSRKFFSTPVAYTLRLGAYVQGGPIKSKPLLNFN